MSDIVLYDYWRSSASYRLRIALNLVGLPYRAVPVDLVKAEHRGAAHLQRNPQGFVPALQVDGQLITQSLAIIEYLHETRGPTDLLPAEPLARARVRQVAHAIAMDIHPICNLRILARVDELTGGGEDARRAWNQEFIGEGLDAVEALVADGTSRFAFGDAPCLADCCIVPQLYNARRWGCDVERWPRLVAIDLACGELEPFRAAHPDAVRPEA